jgi:hypothetical protein
MKKIAIVLFVASAALAGCSKKKADTTPTTPAADTAGSAAPAEGEAGSAAPAEGGEAGSAAPAEGGEAGGSAM